MDYRLALLILVALGVFCFIALLGIFEVVSSGAAEKTMITCVVVIFMGGFIDLLTKKK